MASANSVTQTFNEALTCPICFGMFEGRIFQCTQGHSFCETCFNQIQVSSVHCPQCRSEFAGTRNYILEELLKHLKILKQNALDAEQTSTNTETKNISLEVIFNPVRTPALNANSTQAVVESPLNCQPPGLFHCRILSCVIQLPTCRLLNHIRTSHFKNLSEFDLPQDQEFVTHLSFLKQDYRQVIHIQKFGLFFFIVNYKKFDQKHVITAWVQRVCPNRDAREYTFHLEMKLGHLIGSYSDYVYGNSSDADYIEKMKQCWYMDVSRRTKKVSQIEADLKIFKTERSVNMRRQNTTSFIEC